MNNTSAAASAARHRLSMFRQVLRQGFDSDKFAVELAYRDDEGTFSIRVITPICFVGSPAHSVRAECLGRQDIRLFRIDRIESVRLLSASDVLAPVPVLDVR